LPDRGRRQRIGLHREAFDLEPGRIDVGEIVRRHIERALQRELPRQSDIEGIIHLWLLRGFMCNPGASKKSFENSEKEG
jgi:hypothetical protein